MRKSTTEDAGQLLLLDTHIAVWLAEKSSRLKPKITSRIEQAFVAQSLCLSPISAWELGMLCAKGRLRLAPSPGEWLANLVEQFGFQILEMTPTIALHSNFLTGNLHADPSDRILIATAIANGATLVTADSNLIRYGREGSVRILPAH